MSNPQNKNSSQAGFRTQLLMPHQTNVQNRDAANMQFDRTSGHLSGGITNHISTLDVTGSSTLGPVSQRLVSGEVGSTRSYVEGFENEYLAYQKVQIALQC